MKKEHVLVAIAGLFILSYVLEAVVNPLTINLPTPYHFLDGEILKTYPFTAASIFIRAIGIFLTPLLLFSFASWSGISKALTLMVLIALMQLYALQDIATKASVVPLEWALSISIAGIALIGPAIWYFLSGILSTVHKSLGGKDTPQEETSENEQ